LTSHAESTDQGKIESYLKWHLKKMNLLNQKPYHIPVPDPALCSAPFQHLSKTDHWINILVSPESTNQIMTGVGLYSVGSVILKQKFLDSEGRKADIYTGMLKRERGYNPECGDWEFFTLDSSGFKVTSCGKLKSCMECHEKCESSDYVTRRYLTSKSL
jgi:hypothetical protein